jgi:CDI immunity proteins
MYLSDEIDQSRTLTELEGDDWGPPPFDSYLVRTIHALRYEPLRDFTVEDLRITNGQSFSLLSLIPLALARLRENVLAEGAFYPGDLLGVVLRSDPDLWREMLAVIEQIYTLPAGRNDDLAFLEPELSFLPDCFQQLVGGD